MIVWRWLRDLWRGAADIPRGLDERVDALAAGWGVACEVAWQIARRCAALHALSFPEASADLAGLRYAESVREIGER